MHVVSILIFSFIYLCVLKSDILFLHISRSVRITLRQPLHRRLEECTASVWERWSKQATKLQLRVDVENRKKVGDYFYKMDQESIVTIREGYGLGAINWNSEIVGGI